MHGLADPLGLDLLYNHYHDSSTWCLVPWVGHLGSMCHCNLVHLPAYILDLGWPERSKQSAESELESREGVENNSQY
jgi:hypothetical protein